MLKPSLLMTSRLARYSIAISTTMIKPMRIATQRHCFNSMFHSARHQRQPQRLISHTMKVTIGNRNNRWILRYAHHGVSDPFHSSMLE